MLDYAVVDFSKPAPVPPPKVNGGRYTGEAARGDWGAIPVAPDATSLVSQTLQPAALTPAAVYMIPGYERPGNNRQKVFGQEAYQPELYGPMTCIRD